MHFSLCVEPGRVNSHQGILIFFSSRRLEWGPPCFVPTGILTTTFRAAFEISAPFPSRRPWTFPAREPTSSLQQAQPPRSAVRSLPLSAHKGLLHPRSPHSRSLAWISITKGELSRESFRNKESLFQSLLFVYLNGEGGNSFWTSQMCTSGWLLTQFLPH